MSPLKPAILVSIALGLAGAAHAADEQVLPFAPHRAVYDLTLEKAVGNKSPVSARGRIVYEFTGSACEGYVTNFRQVTELQPEEGGTRLSDMHSHTLEDGGGKTFSFKIESSVDDAKRDDLDGTATRAGDGDLSIDLSSPQAAKLDVGPGIVFPTQHLERIIAAAKAGEHTVAVKAYDGSDTGTKVYDTLTVIGKPAEAAPSDLPASADGLKSVRRWPVTVSYFDGSKADGGPAYLLSFELFENGVSNALKLDYGDFTLAGKLVKFEALPVVACTK